MLHFSICLHLFLDCFTPKDEKDKHEEKSSEEIQKLGKKMLALHY